MLFKKRSSLLIYNSDKVGNGSIPASFRVFWKITSRKLSAAPMIADTFAANSFLAAAKSAGTVVFIVVYIAGFYAHSFSFQGGDTDCVLNPRRQ